MRTRQEIEAEVEELATEIILKADPTMTIEAARSLIYEEIPEIYQEYQDAPHASPVSAISKVDREPTLGEEIHAAVRKRAAQLAWTEWPTKSVEDLEWEVWSSPEGQALYGLYTSEEGRKPMSQVESHIGKSAQHRDVWRVFQEWRVE